MDNSITGAIIGAASAIVINGLIFIVSRSNELKSEKIFIISEIISHLHGQLKYSKRFVGHQIWLNYYQRAIPLIKKPEYHSIVQDKIENQIKNIEDIESKFIDRDSKLASLAAKYKSLFHKDNHFSKSLKEINDYVIADHIVIENFNNWGDDLFHEQGIHDKVQEVELKTYEKLGASLEPMINALITYLEKKI